MFVRSGYLVSVSAIAVSLFGPFNPSHAQETEVRELDTVVITGYRSSLASAMEAKRASTAVIDSITAEDIGDFPDRNISEALQRVTGVTVFRSGAGEGQTISVRGAPATFTQTTLNGVTVASGNAGREFDFDVFASELFQNVTLTKTPSADITEGGLSATVDLRTPRPFSFSEPQLVGSLTGQYSELGLGDIEPRLTALASNKFLNGRLGILGSVAYSELTSRGDISQGFSFQTLRQAGWNPNTAENLVVNGETISDRAALTELADSVLMPTLPRTGPEIKTLERLGLSGAIQFDATPNLRFGLDVLYADYSELNLRPAIWPLTGFGGARGLREITLVDDFFAQAGRIDNVAINSETVDETFESETRHVTADVSWDLAPNWNASFNLGYSGSEEDELRRTYIYSYNDTVTYDLSNPQYPVFGSENQDFLDVTAFSPSQLRFRPASREDEVRVARTSITRLFDGAPLQSIKVGASYSEQTKSQTRGEARRAFTTPFSDVAVPLIISDLLPDAPASTPTQFLQTDFGLGRQLLLPDDTIFPIDFPGVFAISEQVAAGFVRTDWAFELAGRNVTADAGVRFVKTDQTSDGFSIASGVAAPVSQEQSYSDVLPNLNLKVDLNNQLVARFAANRAMARPTLTDLSPGATVLPTQRRATIGNPELDPFRATQIDLGLEWYFADEALLSATLFYKDIDAFVARVTAREVLSGTNLINDAGENVSGLEFDVTRPQNGSGGTLSGIELAYQQPFTFLPAPLDGFGVAANVTLSESEGPITVAGIERKEALPGQSDLSYNLVGYYEKNGISLRAAWSYRSDFIELFGGTLPDGTLLIQREDDRGQLDLSARYDFSPHAALTFEAINVNGEDRYSYVRDERLNRLLLDQGAVYMVGIRLKR